MSLNLDTRQRAMLEVMGVKLWQPLAVDESITPAKSVTPSAPEKIADHASAHRLATRYEPKSTAPEPSPALNQTLPATLAPRPAIDLTPVATLDWPTLQTTVASCQACGLCQGRKTTVFGTGDHQARWLVVGDAPSEADDAQGQPFTDAPNQLTGQLLDNMLKAVGLARNGTGEQAVFITNALKCRPPASRNPQADEVAQCEPYLRRQVALIQPHIILALGRVAAQSLLQATLPEVTTLPLGKLRGQVHRYQGVPVVVSYPPAYLLRAPHDKAKAWADLCLAMAVMKSA
jgi:uracil-DNA glycosylase